MSFSFQAALLFVLCFSLFSCKESTNDALKQENPIKEGDLGGYYACIINDHNIYNRPPYEYNIDIKPLFRIEFLNLSGLSSILGTNLHDAKNAYFSSASGIWRYDEVKKELLVNIKNPYYPNVVILAQQTPYFAKQKEWQPVAPWKVVRKKGVIHLVVLDDQGKIYSVFKQIKPMPFDESDFIQQSDLP